MARGAGRDSSDAATSRVEALVAAVRSGDVAAVAAILTEEPSLATGPVPGGGGRSLLHVATDWPGHLPKVAETIALVVAHGADVDAPFAGPHAETPLHWAASSDDVEALDALLDAGASIDAAGAVVGGGTALNDATAFAQWNAASRLVERGAAVTAWDAAALGLVDALDAALVADPLIEREPLLWAACHGGQPVVAEPLLDAGADPNWVGWDDLTALDAAERSGATDVVEMLQARGALRGSDLR